MNIIFSSLNALGILPGLIFGFYLLYTLVCGCYYRADLPAQYLLIFMGLNAVLAIACLLFNPFVKPVNRNYHG